MKFLVIGDCHGERPEIDKGDVGEADAILCTGDFCSGGEKMRSLMFESMDESWEWYERMGEGKAREAVLDSIKQGREILEHLNSFGKPVYMVPGNWDWSGEIYHDWDFLQDNKFQEMVEGLKNVYNVNSGSETIQGFTVVGYGPCSRPEVPQYEDDKPETKQEREGMEREYLENRKMLTELFKAADNPVVFLSHNVPFNTGLDQIDNPDSPVDGRHYGSLVVRELIEEFSPVLSVGGHIHEGYGEQDLEGTKCVNAGLNAYIVIEVDSSVVGMSFNPEVSNYSD